MSFCSSLTLQTNRVVEDEEIQPIFLRLLLQRVLRNVFFLFFYDAAAVELACKSRVNSEIEITLNCHETNEYSKQLKVKTRAVYHSTKVSLKVTMVWLQVLQLIPKKQLCLT